MLPLRGSLYGRSAGAHAVHDPEVYCDLPMGDLGRISLRDSMCN